MRTPCTVVLDEPIMIAWWEYHEFFTLAGSPFVLQFVMGPAWAMAVAGGALIGSYLLKRGKPAGFLWHLLHILGLFWFRLPGVLPPYAQRYGAW
jgi:hypothetical protein